MAERDNYEICRTDWQKRFVSMDNRALMKKLPFLKQEKDSLLVPYFNHFYLADTTNGLIHPVDMAPPLTLYDELNIYTLFWFVKDDAKLQYNFVPFYQLQSASPFAAAFEKGTLQPLAAMFDGKEAFLQQGLSRMGGSSVSDRHTAFEVPVFPCMPVQVLFWDGDDEFPAQANLLFDRSATDFIHVESVVSIASSLLHRLSAESGISLSRSAF